jgi:hypothetical protein
MYLIRSLLFLALSGVAASAAVERKLEKSFTVQPGSSVKVDISGGSIESRVGEPGTVHLILDQRFRSADTEAEADAILANYEVIAEQSGDEVVLRVRAKKKFNWGSGSQMAVSARIVVPSTVQLDLNTSGGAINVLGEMTSSVLCETSGGGIKVDGGPGDFKLDTSGGGISVERALGSLHADTSGGGIQVKYVGPQARDINLDTSGGGISVGVDASGKFDLVADTSGGSVKVEGLSFEAQKKDRDHASGPINGGGAPLRADTSGGNITIKAIAARD